MEAQRALHDRANLQHQLAFTISRVNVEREEKEAILAERAEAEAAVNEEHVEKQEYGVNGMGEGGESNSENSNQSHDNDIKNTNKNSTLLTSSLEELKWKKETMEMEVGKLREEMETICRDRDEGKSQLKVKTLEMVEKQAKCDSLTERLDEAEKKTVAAVEAGKLI